MSESDCRVELGFVKALDLNERGYRLCDGDELLALGDLAAVAPALPTNDLDVWIGPREHITSLPEVEPRTRSAWLEALQSLIGRWRTNCEADGANVFAYLGSSRDDWPAHVALRVIGRRMVEPAIPCTSSTAATSCRSLQTRRGQLSWMSSACASPSVGSLNPRISSGHA